jgi:hypothetical protein
LEKGLKVRVLDHRDWLMLLQAQVAMYAAVEPVQHQCKDCYATTTNKTASLRT